MDIEAYERFLNAYVAAETEEEAREIKRAYEAIMPPRDKVVEQMLNASTMEQIKAAESVANDWMKEHPEDIDYIARAGESLRMKREGLEFKRARLS